MPPRFSHRFTPSIKPVTAQQYAVHVRVLAERVGELLGQQRVVLRVGEDGNAFLVNMRGNAGESLQQLIAFDGDMP